MRFLLLSVALGTLASCGTTHVASTTKRSKEYFAESVYGVKASKRVVYNGPVPKGGGRDMVGNPYVVKGKRYYPKEDRNYDRVGYASWYGSAFHGRYTANGEIYDQYSLTAAHPTFPLPSYARVTNTENGASIIVRVNDRGPYERGRIIDLSNKTAEMLDMKGHGSAKVRVQYVGRARMDGQDEAYLMASYIPKGSRIQPSTVAPGVMVASAGNTLPEGALPNPPIPARSPALAMEEPVKQPASFASLNQTFVILPEFGPIPPARPASVQFASGKDRSYVSGYAEGADVNKGVEPFRVLVADDGGLDAAKIKASYQSANGN